MDNKFYVRSRHGDTGCNVVFHQKDGCGYGTNLDKLHLFTIEEAQRHIDNDIKSLPLLASEVDLMAIRAVDMQGLDADMDIITESDRALTYVIQIDGDWNGNDIYFKCDGGRTYNYDEATVYNFIDAFNIQRAEHRGVMWTRDYMDKLARRTFQSHNINTRKMVTGPGIKYKKPRKARPTTGKTRGNCPDCGKITWDFNPYENAYCGDHGPY